MPLENVLNILHKGGPRSGNFGHEGRPGKVGGSAASNKGSASFVEPDPQELNRYYNLPEKCGVVLDCEALKMYTHSGYDVANKQLRTGSYQDSISASEWRDKEVKDLIAGLDKSFQNAPVVPENIKVYRGVDGRLFEKLSQGDIFIDKGFVSTSIDASQTMSGFKLEIRVPKGTRGIYLEQVSQIPSEMELLLNRGTRFRVAEVNLTTNKFGNRVGTAVLEIEND